MAHGGLCMQPGQAAKGLNHTDTPETADPNVGDLFY